MEHLEMAYTLYKQWLGDSTRMELLAQAVRDLSKDFPPISAGNFKELIKLLETGDGDKTAAANAIRTIQAHAASAETSETDSQMLKQLAEWFLHMAFPAT